MTIPLTVNMWHKTTQIEALLDCGAIHNFIDPRAIKTLSMGTNSLKQPLLVHNVDGTINRDGTITHYCNLWVRRGKHVEKLGFYVANLGWDRMILGYPWFQKFNPQFDWNTHTLKGDEVEIDTAGYRTKLATSLRAVTLTEADREEDRKTVQAQIPEAYHKYWEVFSEWASYRYPPKREEDHAIILKEGALDKIDCKIYRQTEEELEATCKFIEESLAKGYITDSKLPYAAALFYRKKKSGQLRPIMDYRTLNKWTVRDNYPLPLISNIIDRLQGKTLFSKFNIHWGYNNIRIKEEDRWKAAFKTPFGLYKPTVMYFGLTNSPATFCRAMQKMLRHWLNKYPDETGNYIDDMVVATKGDRQCHQQIVGELLQIFQENSYFLQPAKCEFEVSKIKCLRASGRWDDFINRPKEGGWTSQLAPHFIHCERSTKRTRSSRLPMTIHSSLRRHRTTPHHTHKEKHTFCVDHGVPHRSRHLNIRSHGGTHFSSTRYEPTILFTSRRLSIRYRSHPVTTR